tara:strand:+ start:132467 stop:133777 length:1311 start_codon:yes stop_codon:yes gene_type:complete
MEKKSEPQINTPLTYLSGMPGYWQTEALANTLPLGQNTPQKPAHGLYAEQLNGSAFTRPRHQNIKSWLYRIYPQVKHHRFEKKMGFKLNLEKQSLIATPEQLRWDPMPPPAKPKDFLAGCQTFISNGNPMQQDGAAVHLYAANQSMVDYFYNADGELLIIPCEGALRLKTEMGILEIKPKEIAVIPRGVVFQVECLAPVIKGYVCENFGAPFCLPDLGPIGSNGLANPRDFCIPNAWFEDKAGAFNLICKYGRQLWSAPIKHSPLNVVAWHGNYAPYKYNLSLFNAINTVSYDHCDPSIFTVLTSQTALPGLANIDFVIFPERWMVAENTFRPPYYHRNIMSEYMGLIHGTYDAKKKGFAPGGGSLHNCMSGHGPDAQTTIAAREACLKPEKQENTLAFMIESHLPWYVTQEALSSAQLQKNYQDCWQDLPKFFKG